METRKLTGFASLVGILGILIFLGGRWVESQLMVSELPAWAVYGTAGTSILAYVYLIKAVAPILMVTVALGGGYYIGRRVDFSNEHRRLIPSFAAGITLGVSVVWLALIRSMILSIGDIPNRMFHVSESQATQMIVMDIVIPIITLISVVGQVGLIIFVGMLAGCGLAHVRKDTASPHDPTESDTSAISPSSHRSDSKHSGKRSQPVD